MSTMTRFFILPNDQAIDPQYITNLFIHQVQFIRPQGYKTFLMLNSTEHEIYPAHKY